MCNKLHLIIKSVSSAAPKHGFVPCGKCYDCRTSLKNSWIFRLRVELEKLQKKGWQIGFFTLTYSDKYLPKIPYMLFDGEWSDVPCFNKADVRSFFVRLKKWLSRTYDAKRYKLGNGLIADYAPRWIVCSEFGEHTARPHYHSIICVPPNVDMLELHKKIKKLWYHSEKPDVMNLEPTEKGFVFPFDFNGGIDSHGYKHNGFVCESAKAAAVYAAKYVCKDLAFFDFTAQYKFHRGCQVFLHDVNVEEKPDFVFESDLFGDIVDCYVRYNAEVVTRNVGDEPLARLKLSDYFPFHLQSRSLGLCFLDGISDSDRLNLLRNGFAFDGESTFNELPVYLKNKIVFDPDYVYEDGKRLVRRKVKPFFRKNLDEIFRLKVQKMIKRIQDWQSEDYWRSIGAEHADLEFVRTAFSFRTTDSKLLAEEYFAYYGVPYTECYSFQNAALQWFRRYDIDYVDITNCPLIHYSYYRWLHYFFSGFLRLQAKYSASLCECKTTEERDVNFVHDFWRSRV